ncbi:MAG: sulfatase-like hydrolase/transferase [Pseudomonadota bacterium]
MSQPRKNIMLISFDDAVAFWKYKTVFGEALQTPNLDRICEQSAAFKSAFCQAPICGPSRSSFMSGKTPHQLGVFDNRTSVFSKISPDQMWPYRLKKAGYFCSSGGKVHHGFRPLPQEIHEVLYSDERKPFRIDWQLPKGRPRTLFGGHRGGVATTEPEDDERFHDANAAASAIEFLDRYDSDAPFYREVGFYGPHGPFITPKRFKEQYTLNNFRKPGVWKGGADKNAFADTQMVENFDTGKTRYWKKSVRNYFSALSHVDHHLGKVWDALKASRHADNTIVILLADHGFHLGERNRYRKSTLWEQVANVPFIIHDPARAAPLNITDPSAVLDVGPTVLDYAGLAPMEDCVGTSLRPVVEGERLAGRVIPTFHGDSVGIRKGKYRLIRYADGSTQLYDVAKDWWQMNDLGQDHEVFGDMYASLVETCKTYGFDISRAAAA